jgi:hypothetical protein
MKKLNDKQKEKKKETVEKVDATHSRFQSLLLFTNIIYCFGDTTSLFNPTSFLVIYASGGSCASKMKVLSST